MKEFLVYTGLRIALFFAAFGIVFGVWYPLAGAVPILWAVVIAFLISGVGSYYLLNRQRTAFATRVEARAERATARFEEMRAKEDTDDPDTDPNPDRP